MSYIKREFCDRILEEADIVAVISDFVELKRSGANMKGLSPFVDEKTPSFTVSPVKNIFKDFASGKGGNVLTFLMEHENFSYPEAIEYLAKKYNREIEYESKEFAEKKKETLEKKEALRLVLSATHRQYINEFNNLPEDHPAKMEVARRGYSPEKVKMLGLGFAPQNFLYDKLKNSGKVSEGEALGLIKRQNGRSGYYDQYGDRLIYPIHDSNGLLIGFAGRALGEAKKAKWINPDVNDQNILYRKEVTWYGMNIARSEIRNRKSVWINEGYNDVIAWQGLGLTNTVAACGTAITDLQIQQLSKLCDKVIIAMDPDRAGRASALKYIPKFLEKGMTVMTADLPDGLDPDDFSREFATQIFESGKKAITAKPGSFEKYLKESTFDTLFEESEDFREAVTAAGVTTLVPQKDGFKLLLKHYYHEEDEETDKVKGAKELCKIIAATADDTLATIYREWLQKDTKIKIATINRWIEEFSVEAIEVKNEEYVQIELPAKVTCKLKEVEEDIRKYGMFMSDNQIWMSLSEAGDNKIRFTSISNFMIEVLQHMDDEKIPSKLFRIKNVHGMEKIFDSDSKNINSHQNFDNMVTDLGNYNFLGSRSHLLKLRTYLLDKMGQGRKIEQLGWQVDGKMFVWNNKVTSESGQDIPLDKHGIFIKEGVHYYLPSANEIYRNNPFKFEAQKKFKVIRNKRSFEVLGAKMMEVHKSFAIDAMLFATASLFQDIVVTRTQKFPVIFFYGPGGTGKDELSEIIQSFVGHPQTAINLEANISTVKAQVRELAQFVNGISQFSEYKSGNPQVDGMIKSFWDRRGYKRGNIESMFSTDSVPIMSSVILTGNDYPKDQPVIIRLIWNEMTRNKFSEEEMKHFDELKDMVADGLSGYSDDLLKYRPEFEKDFDKVQRTWKSVLKEHFPDAEGRVIFNLSILGTAYTIFKDKIQWPFTQAEMIAHWRTGVEQQIRKINSASILNKFWDLFIASLRGHKDDRIQVNQIVSISSNLLFLQWTHVFAKIQRSWWSQYNEGAPKKEIVMEQLVKSGAFVESLSKHSFDSGRQGNRTSAIVINLDALSETTRSDIQGSIMYQLAQMDQDPFSPESPATPEKNKILAEKSEDPPELPF